MRPALIEVEVDIRSSPQAVFDYCSDLSHEPEWNPMMKRIEKVTDGPIGVGARYATEFAKGPQMVIEYTSYERPTRWASVGDSATLKASGSGQVVHAPDGTPYSLSFHDFYVGQLPWIYIVYVVLFVSPLCYVAIFRQRSHREHADLKTASQ